MGTRGNEGRSDSEPNFEVLFMMVYTEFYVAYDFEDQPKEGILPGLIMMFLEDL